MKEMEMEEEMGIERDKSILKLLTSEQQSNFYLFFF